MSARRTLVPVAVLGAVAALLTVPAEAAPKTITKSFDMTLPVPGGAVSNPTTSAACAPEVETPASTHTEELTAPAAGTLKVEVTGFIGDWDISLTDDKGKRLADGDNAAATGTSPNTGSIVEKLTYKAKKPGNLIIIVCNFAGGPQGKGKYTFTYGK